MLAPTPADHTQQPNNTSGSTLPPSLSAQASLTHVHHDLKLVLQVVVMTTHSITQHSGADGERQLVLATLGFARASTLHAHSQQEEGTYLEAGGVDGHGVQVQQQVLFFGGKARGRGDQG